MLPSLVMLLCLQYGGVCSASPMPQVLNLLVEYGDSAILPCNGSAYIEEAGVPGEEEGEFRWEAMGEDVVYFQGGELIEGRGYQGRVQLASEEGLREGNWSLVLDRVMLNDANMYECIWQGRRTISTVWLKVKEPSPERSLVVWLGASVELPCYVQVPKSQALQDLHLWWTKNGHVVATLYQTHVEINEDPSRFTLWTSETMEDFGLIISPVLIHDHGEYQCLYKTRSSDDPKPGIPEDISLIVLGTESTYSVLHPNETETWTNTSTWMTISTSIEAETTTEPETEVETTQSPSDPIPLLLEESTQPQQVATMLQPMEALEETVTSFPDEGKYLYKPRWFENPPLVRIGLIAGVLVVTAVALCILGALRKI